jgi:hypothetical protein
MTPYEKHPSKFIQRLAEDMKIRNLAPATIDSYTYHARRFADFIQKPLDRATVEDVRNFQLHLIENRKLAYSSFNQCVCALRFLYIHTIRVPWPVTMVPFGKRPKHLPTVLSRQEVDELLRCTENLKHRTFLSTLYACGMRISEAANLQVPMSTRRGCRFGSRAAREPKSDSCRSRRDCSTNCGRTGSNTAHASRRINSDNDQVPSLTPFSWAVSMRSVQRPGSIHARNGRVFQLA